MCPENRIDRAFHSLRAANQAALIPYITAGFPEPSWTLQLLRMLAESGASLIELGVPFSDPIADGPTIQAACKTALEKGTTLSGVLEIVRQFRAEGYETPIVLFGALNPFLHFGIERFAQSAAKVGCDGVLIPDVPVEEAGHVQPALSKVGLHFIHLVAPTTPPERKCLIAAKATGFIYYISIKGVTGARAQSQFDLSGPMEELRALTPLPVVVGFGIATPAQAAEVARQADGVVVGSALVDRVSKEKNVRAAIENIGSWFSSLRHAVERARA